MIAKSNFSFTLSALTGSAIAKKGLNRDIIDNLFTTQFLRILFPVLLFLWKRAAENEV